MVPCYESYLEGGCRNSFQLSLENELCICRKNHFILHNDLYLFIRFVFQFGNTCYSNSVLQALYFCKPFREKVLEYKARNKRTKETLLTCLADLFYSIATQKKKVGSIAPKKFIARLRKEKGWYC